MNLALFPFVSISFISICFTRPYFLCVTQPYFPLFHSALFSIVSLSLISLCFTQLYFPLFHSALFPFVSLSHITLCFTQPYIPLFHSAFVSLSLMSLCFTQPYIPLLYPPQTLFVVGIYTPPPPKLCLWWVYCFHVVRLSVCPSVTFCFLDILKSRSWIFIKPCKHVNICKTNTLDKKVRARGQFY